MKIVVLGSLCTIGSLGQILGYRREQPESETVPVLERLSEALRPGDLKKRVRMRVTGVLIHATFS